MSGEYAGQKLVGKRIKRALEKSKKRKPTKAQKARALAKKYRREVLGIL